jgi:hypothetical protein
MLGAPALEAVSATPVTATFAAAGANPAASVPFPRETARDPDASSAREATGSITVVAMTPSASVGACLPT